MYMYGKLDESNSSLSENKALWVWNKSIEQVSLKPRFKFTGG